MRYSVSGEPSYGQWRRSIMQAYVEWDVWTALGQHERAKRSRSLFVELLARCPEDVLDDVKRMLASGVVSDS